MKKIFGLISGALSPLFLVPPVFANITIDICPTTEPGKTLCEFGKQAEALQRLIRFAITTIFIFAALIAIFFLIFGGIKWMLSGGDKTAIEGARNTIVAAIVGLVIVIIAFVIVNILGTVFGINLFQFTLPKV